MFPVIIQDSLPAVSLQFQRILRLRVKGDADLGLVVVGLEQHGGPAPPELVGELDAGLNVGVHRLKVKAVAPVLGFHAGMVASAHPQVVAGLGTMPAGVRKIPLGNVIRPGISVPGFLQVHRNGGLDGDFLVFHHGVGGKLDLSNGHGLVEQLHIEMNLCVQCFEYLDDRFKSRIG